MDFKPPGDLGPFGIPTLLTFPNTEEIQKKRSLASANLELPGGSGDNTFVRLSSAELYGTTTSASASRSVGKAPADEQVDKTSQRRKQTNSKVENDDAENEAVLNLTENDTIATDVEATLVEGQDCASKTLYEGPSKCRCCINWVEEYPDDLRESIEQTAESKVCALVLRKSKSHDTDDPLQLHSIVIQSPYIKEMLKGVFNGYPGVEAGLSQLTFEKPFQPFLHRWSALQAALGNMQEGVAKSHCQLLYDTLSDELSGVVSESRDLIAHGVITMKLLWTLFKPEDIVYSLQTDGDRAFKLVSSDYYERPNGSESYEITCTYIDYDGDKMGRVSTALSIEAFTGTKKILNLPVIPMVFRPDARDMSSMLIDRGHRFEKLAGIHLREYHGTALVESPGFLFSTKQREIMVSERIMVDAKAYNADAAADDDPGPLGRMSPKKDSNGCVLDDHSLTEEEYLLCVASVKGFCLTSKKYAKFEVLKVSDVQWHPEAFETLVLAESYKNMIMALLEGQLYNEVSFQDTIPGKGQSMIMLLSGSPGTGKTLTVESVADILKAPLYAATAGDLGLSASNVEENLGRIFENAARWKAVLLLDEADVFLEQRKISDVERNKLVTIFLRLLEYYRGILFLTTNRVFCFDHAFISRIDMHIKYPELDATARSTIWKNIIRKSCETSSIRDEEIAELAESTLNGRNIRNVVKMAHLLSNRTAQPLSVEHIRAALDVASV